jgi:hydroxymethylpyrimidine/phosphomethylpyrimidine kinase
MNQETKLPVVLSIAGHDPTGGAGIQADIEALLSVGCHAATVITCLTVQDTRDVIQMVPVAEQFVLAQIRAILEDVPVAAIKIGLLGSAETAEAIHSVLVDYPNLPVVLDPVLSAGGGAALSDEGVLESIRGHLLQCTTVVTPNSREARRLAPAADNLDACAMALLEMGADFALITGAHEPERQVINRLYGGNRVLDKYVWERLPAEYHGSGCTLAAAIAGLLAQGSEPRTAIQQAQRYTWKSLDRGYRIGMGQHVPNRLFWTTRTGLE